MAPVESESASNLLCCPTGSGKAYSSIGVQVAPESGENQTPPLAAPTYTRPPGPTAIAVTRPLTTGFPEACPCATTDGPSGVQYGITAGGAAAGRRARSWTAWRSIALFWREARAI